MEPQHSYHRTSTEIVFVIENIEGGRGMPKKIFPPELSPAKTISCAGTAAWKDPGGG